MSELIMQLSEVMRAEVKSLDQVAHNAANLATPGFRSERSVLTGDFLSQVTANSHASNTSLKAQPGISLKDGPLQVTGNQSELALRGTGWFVVASPDGPKLTRDGRFHLDAEGSLVDRRGYSVLTDTGSVSGLDKSFHVSADGTISTNGNAVAKLRIVSTSDMSALRSLGDGLYHYAGDVVAANNAAVIQGAYEASNVDTAADMMLLMRTTRHIETLQRSMSAYDQMLSTGINQLGK